MGVAIFLETSIFGVECLFVSRFGTVTVAANQAAMSFTNLLYMVPLSFPSPLLSLLGPLLEPRIMLRLGCMAGQAASAMSWSGFPLLFSCLSGGHL